MFQAGPIQFQIVIGIFGASLNFGDLTLKLAGIKALQFL